MEARGSNNRCKSWRNQDCTNCQHLSKDASSYYYKANRKLWHAGRGNPLTGERCEGCELKDYSLVKQLIERVKMDASDLFETIGCLNVEVVAPKQDMVIMLESISENLGSCTSRAGVLGLRVKDIDRETQVDTTAPGGSMGNIIVMQKEGSVKSSYMVQ
jgi:hypothetical protein